MKKTIFLMVFAICLACLFCFSVGAQETNEFADTMTTLDIDTTGMSSDAGAKVVLKHTVANPDDESNPIVVYTTYPAQYIVTSNNTLKLDFTKINNELSSQGISYDKYSVIRIQIPSHITVIGGNNNFNFGGNTGNSKALVEVDFTRIAQSFTIGHDSFKNCTGLTSLYLPDNARFDRSYQFSGCSGLTDVRLPNGITAIPTQLLAGCSKIKTLYIPNGITVVGSTAFKGVKPTNCIMDASKLKTVEESGFHDSSIILQNVTALESVGKNAFRNCSGVSEVSFAPTLSLIGSYAFNSSSVTKVTFNGGSYSIGKEAFSAVNVNGPLNLRGCTSVAENAFNGAKGVTSIIIGNEMVTLEQNALKGCNSTTLITGAKLETIGNYALNLTTTYVYLSDTIESISTTSFNGSGTHYFITSTDSEYIAKIKEAVSSNATVITYADYTNPENAGKYTSGEYIITGCNKCDTFYDGKHFVEGNNDCTLSAYENHTAPCSRCPKSCVGELKHADVQTIAFPNGLMVNGVRTFDCTNEGCTIADITKDMDESVVAPIFTPIGFSIGPDGMKLKCGYDVNTTSLGYYKNIAGAEYGVLIANANSFGTNELFVNGVVSSDKAMQYEINNIAYSKFNIDISGFNANNASSFELIIAIYVTVGNDTEVVQFVNNNYPASKLVGSKYYSAITFNQVRIAKGLDALIPENKG